MPARACMSGGARGPSLHQRAARTRRVLRDAGMNTCLVALPLAHLTQVRNCVKGD